MSKVGSLPTQLLYGLAYPVRYSHFLCPIRDGAHCDYRSIDCWYSPYLGFEGSGQCRSRIFCAAHGVCGVFRCDDFIRGDDHDDACDLEEHAGIEVLWSQWLVAFLPLSIAMIVVSVTITKWLYLGEKYVLSTGKPQFQQEIAKLGPWTVAEKKSLFWFALAVGLWATDFIHHTNPAMIGLGAGLMLSLPRIGVLDGKAIKQTNFLAIIFSAGAISMGNVLLETNTLPRRTGPLLGWMQPLLTNPISYTWRSISAGFSTISFLPTGNRC